MTRSHVTVRFLISNALSLLGNSVSSVALPLILLATTGNPLAAGMLALICSVPQLVIGVAGGAVLDRINRRDVSIISDVISALSVALLPVVDMIWGLSFGWFVALGLLGSIGDIPGMTARDAMFPAVVKHDGADMQRFMGFSQSLDSIVTIVGPALAALFIGFVGEVPALWFTAAMSFAAALATLTIPRRIGAVGYTSGQAEKLEAERAKGESKPQGALAALKTGLVVLFRKDAILSTSVALGLLIIMVLGSYQSLILPVFFTQLGQPQLLGFTLSVMSAGLLVGSVVYASFTHKLKRRTWYVVSFIGMAAGLSVLGVLPAYPVMLAGAFLLGLSAGPASALLGFFMMDRIPDTSRGCALGTQNSLVMVCAPLAIFAMSVAVSLLGVFTASLVLAALWIALTVFALVARAMRTIDDEPDAALSEAPAAERFCETADAPAETA